MAEKTDGSTPEKRCLECGKKTRVVCHYKDVGAVDHYDHFWHTCEHCGYEIEEEENFSCGGCEMPDEKITCPMCGKVYDR